MIQRLVTCCPCPLLFLIAVSICCFCFCLLFAVCCLLFLFVVSVSICYFCFCFRYCLISVREQVTANPICITPRSVLLHVQCLQYQVTSTSVDHISCFSDAVGHIQESGSGRIDLHRITHQKANGQ